LAVAVTGRRGKGEEDEEEASCASNRREKRNSSGRKVGWGAREPHFICFLVVVEILTVFLLGFSWF
jgi:hypothetical protein